MPANTMDSMILGYAVILGVLLIYVISLVVRLSLAKKRQNNQEK